MEQKSSHLLSKLINNRRAVLLPRENDEILNNQIFQAFIVKNEQYDQTTDLKRKNFNSHLPFRATDFFNATELRKLTLKALTEFSCILDICIVTYVSLI